MPSGLASGCAIAAAVGVLLLAILVGAFCAWSQSFEESMDFIYDCDEASTAQLNSSVPIFPGATLIAKESCSGVGAGHVTFYYASSSDPSTVTNWTKDAWATWAAESGGSWTASGTTVSSGFQPGGGGGSRISLRILGEVMPEPAKDVPRAPVAGIPDGTTVFFQVRRDSSAW